MSRLYCRLLGAERSIGFGREKIDWPDLQTNKISYGVAGLQESRRSARDGLLVGGGDVLSHDCGQSAKLKNVSGYEEQGVQQLFLFAGVTTSGE